MLIYEVYDTLKDKYYIGLTKRTLNDRRVEHLREKKCNQQFHRILQSRPETFIWNIVADNIEDIETLKKIEQERIRYRDSFNNGYNATLGGDWHDVPDGENAYWYNKHWSEEEKEILSQRRRGKGIGIHNAMAKKENRDKVSMAKKGKPNIGGGWNKGIPMTDKQKEILVKATRERLKKYNPFSDPAIIKRISEKHSKPIKIVDLNLSFNSVKECAEYLNCSYGLISSQIKKNKNVKGHKLEYI